jgi:hypothetical protein
VNYATWKLSFLNSNYGTGPEEKIAELGFAAEGALSNGQVENGATILGYVSQILDPVELTEWQFENLSQEEALEFARTIAPSAYLLENGKIATPIEA